MLGLVAALGLTLVDTPSVKVDWHGPEHCPSTRFETELQRLVGPETPPIHVQATAQPLEEGWSLEATFEVDGGARGTRSFRASQCDTVSEAAAVAVALAVDPTLDDPEPAPEPTPEQPSSVPTPPPAPQPRPTDTAPPSRATAPSPPPPDPRPRPRIGIGALASVDGLALPGVGVGVSALVSVQWPRVRVELAGDYRGPTRVQATADPSVGGAFSQWTVGARAAWVPRIGPVELPVGLGVDGGETLSEGRGWFGATTARRPWLAPLGLAGVQWLVLPRVAVMLRGSAGVPLWRHRFHISGLEQLHHTGPVQLRAQLGLEMRL